MAKSIMIQGTMSNVGKSILVGGLCRILKQDGIKVAPFKSQNMALNSFITKEGLEMGRAQVMQAEAAGIEPDTDMNPILLKPTTDTGSQVIVNGEVTEVMSAVQYFKRKQDYVPAIKEAYGRLSSKYDVIVIEGAGSPAEINLKKNDIVNMGLAEMVDAPVLLAGDIDRGGVFAQIVGTILLLEEKERQRIKGTIINKFRGDKKILEPGIQMLEEKCQGIPVCGVVPYVYVDIDEEDSLSERFHRKDQTGLIDVVVIKVPRISNFTDFAPLECRPEINLRYVNKTAEFGNPDLVLLPGSKNTMSDLKWMRESGLEGKVLRHASAGKPVFGICGGYQMMGMSLQDPDQVEEGGTLKGMQLLPVVTRFESTKTRTRVTGYFSKMNGIFRELTGVQFEGYEIHMGASIKEEAEDLVQYKDEVSGELGKLDGTQKGNCYGCYIHGIFDQSKVTDQLIKSLLKEKGYSDQILSGMDYRAYKEQQYDILADAIRENVDMKKIYEIIEKGCRS